MMPNTLHSCLSSAAMEQIGRNDVSPVELIAIEEHLSDCSRCRELFDSHYQSSQWSELIQPALKDSQMDVPSSVAADGIDHSAAILKLLGPTDDPHMLGRIGNYEIVGVIGQGGMGAVFKGFDRSLNRFVAIKMLLPHLAASGAARKRFAREGQAVAAVVDDHVMAIHCVDQWQGIPYLVMTYSRGISLQKRLNESGPLEVREILRIGMQAAKGLAAAHAQGIVHRDIKPSNILLDQNVERVQLVDFGLARAVDDASLTCSGTLAGTPQYMSPEQARAETVDHRSDLFSLGSVLYAMCAGYAPFRADSSYSVLRLIIEKDPRPIREISPDIPDWLCAIIGKLMAKNAGDRFDSAKQVADFLAACLAHVQQPTAVPLPSDVTRLALASKTPTEQAPTEVLATKAWQRFTGPPLGKFVAAALIAVAALLAGVVIVLELNKGTLTIRSVADDVPIRIVQGKETVQELIVSKQGTTTRLRAGNYTIEIDSDSTGYDIQGNNVTIKRGEDTLVNVSIGQTAVVVTQSGDSMEKAKKPADFSNANTSHSALEDSLTAAIDQFNERIKSTYPGNTYPYNQPPLTKDELIAYASWNMERGDKLPATCKAGLATIAKQHQLPENWTIDGFYGQSSNGGEPVQTFQILLQSNDNPAMQMVIRRRFLSPPKDYSLSTATNDQGGTSLAAAVKRFNARHSQAAGIEQPPLTEDEVVAAVLYTKARRDDHDVSDGLFERFQDIARTRQLPEGATLEVIPSFGVEGGPTYTIWSIRLTMLQDEPDKKGWTYGFLLREQFVSVKQGDAAAIFWGTPAENGLQAGMRFSTPLKSIQFGQKIDVELLFRNILTESLPATVPNFPHYEVVASDKEGVPIASSAPHHKVIGGWRVGSIGEQPLSLRGQPLVFVPSTTSLEERGRIRVQSDNEVLIFVTPGKPFRLQLSVMNFANDRLGVLTTGQIELVVGTPELQGATVNLDAETGTPTNQASMEKAKQKKSVVEGIQKAQPPNESGASDSDASNRQGVPLSNTNAGDAIEGIRDLSIILGVAETHPLVVDSTHEGIPIPKNQETRNEAANWISMIDLLGFRSNQETEDTEAKRLLAFLRRRLLDHFEARVELKLTQLLFENLTRQEPSADHEDSKPGSGELTEAKLASLKQKAAVQFQDLWSDAEKAALDTDLHERQDAVKSEIIVYPCPLKFVSSQKAEMAIRNTSRLFGILPETPTSDARTNTLLVCKNGRSKYFTTLAAAMDGASSENAMTFDERIKLWMHRLRLLAILRVAVDENNPVEAIASTTARYRYNLECIEFDQLELARLGIDLDLGDLDSQASPISLKNPSSFLALVVSLENRGLARRVLTLSKRIESSQSVEMTASRSPREFDIRLRPQIQSDGFTADLEFRVTQPSPSHSEGMQSRSVKFDCEGKLEDLVAMNITNLFSDDSKSKRVILLLTIDQRHKDTASPK